MKAEWREVETDWMEVDVGVRQGCILSGLLFIVFVDDLLEEFEGTGKGLCWDAGQSEVLLAALMYADDLEVLAGCEEDLLDMLDVVDRWAKRWRMKVNTNKGKSERTGERGWLEDGAGGRG